MFCAHLLGFAPRRLPAPGRLPSGAGERLVTNAFFGVIRTSVFTALYRQRPEVSGLARSDILTYIWLLEGMFAVIWASWIWEFASNVRSGDFAVELPSPGDPTCAWPRSTSAAR